MKRIRILLGMLTLAAGITAGSLAPRTASADIGPCAGCGRAAFHYTVPGAADNRLSQP